MGIITSVAVRNFKCFRERIKFDLKQGTYIVGPNNAGKTAILQAINCFFDSSNYSPEQLNRTELTRRQTGFNRTDIAVGFDLTKVTGRVRHDRMEQNFGSSLEITKSFTWREQSDVVVITYQIGRKSFEFEQLDDDVKHLLSSVYISYIHPQEGSELLRRAQEKFKKRLFHNWGRHASVSERLAQVQANWTDLRTTANSYLSRALTERIKEIWPSSEVKINLPEKLEDIVAISDIAFRSAQNLPEVTLTSHGTGAQSAILYQTHFLLDSDRSLHPGMYFPVWLLEEPESFLHADIAFQLGRLLASDQWQSTIQMVVSTHSPIILAGSRQSPETKSWILMERAEASAELLVSEVQSSDIRRIGQAMGDANFEVYFNSAAEGPIVLLEDSRPLTKQKFEAAGVPVTKSLNGITDVKKHLAVYLNVGESVNGVVYFIVDGDRGLKELEAHLRGGAITAQAEGWIKHQVAEKVFVIVSPVGTSVEDLFSEWLDILGETLDDVLDGALSIREHIPARLSRVVDVLRRTRFNSRDEAIDFIRPLQDVKDRFWLRAEQNNWQIDDRHSRALSELIGPD